MLHRRLDKWDLCAIVLITLACLLRISLIAQGWPSVTDDEGPVGLMARHIAYQGTYPLFYYGQDYMGPLEAYLGAAFFLLFGPSAFSLRLGLIVLFALFLICFYLLTTLLYSKALALFSLVLLGLGTPEVVFRQLQAAGGPPDYFFFVTLLLLLTSWLAFTANISSQRCESDSKDAVAHPRTGVSSLPWYRLIAYAAWGGIAGLAIWSHLLCLPYVASAGLMVAICCRKELRLPVLALLLLALLLGASPQLFYRAFVPASPTQASLFGGGYHETSGPAPLASTTNEAAIQPTLERHIEGHLMVMLPIAIDGNGLCTLAPGDAWPLTAQTTPRILICSYVHGAWSIGFLLLWFIATITAARCFWSHWRLSSEREDSSEKRREAVRQAARLMLLLGAGGTEFIVSLNPLANPVTPWTSARYLVGLLIAIPAVLYPLWKYRGKVSLPSWKMRLSRGIKYSLLLLILTACLLGTINIFTQEIPRAQASNARESQLIERLLELGARYTYTDNWMCDRIAFESNEQIICSALDQHLRPGLDRYFPYRAMVAQAPHPFYVFLQGSEQAQLFEKLAKEQNIAYAAFTVNRYIIYQPVRRIKA